MEVKKRRVLLTKKELNACLKKHAGWTVNKNETQLQKTFVINEYIDGLVLIARIAVHAEILNHHPDIELSYKKVKVKLTTHSAKGLTALDVMLLKRIEAIAHKN